MAIESSIEIHEVRAEAGLAVPMMDPNDGWEARLAETTRGGGWHASP